MSKNKFYEENFSAFINEQENFFKKLKNKFTKTFLDLLQKQNPQLKITETLKKEVEELYESLFLKDYKTQKFKLDIVWTLKELEIDFTMTLNKVFLLMANAFIKYNLGDSDAISKLKKLASLFEFYLDYLIFHAYESDYFEYSIPKELKHYYLTNTLLNLFNVYKGIPITHKTTILTLNEEKKFIEVEANSYQIIAAKFQREIYLLEPTSNTTFKAYIEEVYPNRKVLKLTNIEKIKRNTPKRNYIRVQPSEKVEVKVYKKEDSCTAHIYDISIKGVALNCESKELEVGDIVKLEFVLNHYKFKLDAEVRSVTKLPDGYRFHFYFEPSPTQERMLEKYVIKREKEIIKELHKYLDKEFIDV